MSKKEKLLQKLKKNPPPKDFKWADFITLMRQYDFTAECDSGGSHFIFEHKVSGYRFSASRTHPSGILKRYQIDKAIEVLKEIAGV
ncbi:MAG: HicA protein [Deltaproteobacteria bacterium]|nr:HicA protein [Deltaproteobacteria bacterium]